MGAEEPVSLEAFAAAQPVRRKCWTCNLPEREELHAARAKGIAVTTMTAWLRSKGHAEATAARLNFHFGAKHE